MGKAPLPHNKRNCYPPYPDHYLKTSIWESRKSDIVSKSLVLVKNLEISSSFLFWPNKFRKSVWYPVPDRKQAILSFKNSSVRKSKIWHFLKELVHGFGQKFEIYASFLFWPNRLGKSVWCRSRWKKAILAFKNGNLRKSKIWHFFRSSLFWPNRLRSVWCCSG